jgi:PAS domain S-box-containing protein
MNNAKILIVEDEAIIAMELESQLQSLGYEVTSIVDTGEKAIQKAEEDKPDLILMDIRIKGEMDGIDTAEVIRNRFRIPVVFSTAYLDEERIDRAKITMPFGYVLKPIQERDLKVTLEMALYVAQNDIQRKRMEGLLCIQRDLGISLGKSMDLQEMLQLCMKAAMNASKMDCGGIYIVDPATKSFDLVYHEGLSEDFVANVSHFNADSSQAQMVMTQNPAYSSHDQLAVNFTKVEQNEKLKSMAIVPVEHANQIIGCLNVASHNFEKIPMFARNALETIANQIGDAIAKKQMEEKLAEKTLYLDNILLNASDSAIATTDIDFRISYFNPLAEDFFGYCADDVIGKTIQEIHLMESVSPERLEKALEQVHVKGEYCYEVTQKTDDGIRYLKSRVSSIVNSEEKLVGYALFSRDITDRKQAEEALLESQRLLVEAQRMAKLGSWEYDLATNKIVWSKEVYSIFGLDDTYTPSLDGLAKSIHPDDLWVIAPETIEKNTKAGIQEMEYRIIDQTTKEIKYVIGRGETLNDSDGNPVKNFGSFQDISDHMLADKELKAVKDRLNLVFDTVSDHLNLIELDSNNQYIVREVNKSLLKATGFTEQQMVGKPIEEMLTEEECQYIRAKCKIALETNEPAFYERIFQVPSGNLTFEVEVHPILDNREHQTYILFVSRDITDRL